MKITINNKEVEVEANTTILQGAEKLGIKIPTLCHLSLDCINVEHKTGSCRICVVEVEGRNNLAPACCTPVADGMVVKTNTMRVIKTRRAILDLILSDHPKECLTCDKSGNCQLQDLADEMNLHRIKYAGKTTNHKIDTCNQSIVRDLNKCIMCRRCETACNTVQTVGVLSGVGRGFDTVVGPPQLKDLDQTQCVFCGQCVTACPVGALTENNNIYKVWSYLNDPKKTVVVQTAPAVRVAIGEDLGMEAGDISTGKMVSAMKMMGFDSVFDTNFAADLTIMEETTEFLGRLKAGENLPILTSCCPGWVKFFEHQFPDLLNIPSTAKSPQQMFGAIAKTYYAEKVGVKPEDMIVVSVMPCLAKKYEANRSEFNSSGAQDVDIVISTRELADMIKEAGIQFPELEDTPYDSPLGEASGAAVIFGASGGVLEAALRTAADWVTGEDLKEIDFVAVRGMQGIKEATVNVAGIDVKAAIASGLGNARQLLERIQAGECDYHIIEIMACPGGCLNGGGQPYIHGDETILQKRFEAIYRDDSNNTVRKSHDNPDIKKLYEEFLGEPGSHKAHELLHTKYTQRDLY